MVPPRWLGRRILAAGAILAGAALGLLGWRALSRPPRPLRILLLAPAAPTGDAALDRGLAVLLTDHLEVLAGATVVQGPPGLDSEALRRLPSDLLLLRIQGRRDGTGLALAWTWTTPARLLARGPAPLETLPPGPPAEVLEQWVARWPLPVRYPFQAALVPEVPDHAWDLLAALAIHDDAAAAAAVPATQRLAEAEPGCATAWVALGDQLYRSLWVQPEQAGLAFNTRTSQAFQRALALVPGHPRATYLGSLFLTDLGDQPRALHQLTRAVRLRPGVPDLYEGLAYAGRTAGLLEGARRALARRQDLLGGLSEPSPWSTETTYLYLGDGAAFARELERARTVRRDASLCFYEGYLALMQGRRAEAQASLREGSGLSAGPEPFRDLCRAYLAALEGRPAEGLAELRAVDEVRGRLRIPDGEWTFKEAEAYALLGDPDRAMDCATRAFVQGFSCAPWYEAAPFLGPTRAHLRWPTLARNVRERQALLERTFPASTFTP